jgi:DNA-binding beta-propeller fold protein YncE
VDERTRRVFVAATNYVKVLDATTGALQRTVGGVAPGVAYIAVDAASNRVFLANRFGSAVSIFDARRHAAADPRRTRGLHEQQRGIAGGR